MTASSVAAPPLLRLVADHADVDDERYAKLLEAATEVRVGRGQSCSALGLGLPAAHAHRRGTMPAQRVKEQGGGDDSSQLTRSDSCSPLRRLEAASQAGGAVPPPLLRVDTQELTSCSGATSCGGSAFGAGGLSAEVASFGATISASTPRLHREIRLA